MDRNRLARRFAALGDETRLEVVENLWVGDLTTGDLAERVGVPVNLLVHHLDILEEAALIRRRRSDGDGRRRYVSLTDSELPADLAPRPVDGGHILFTCSRNSARSQLAVSLFEKATGRVAESAGARPAVAVHPRAVEIANVMGLRMAGHPRGYSDVSTPPDLVVSVCDIAGEESSPFPGAESIHWSVPDPVSDGRAGAFRRAALEIESRVARLAGAIT